MTQPDDQIVQTILALCKARGRGKTICPSEAARTMHPEQDGWRAHMADVRAMAQRMAQDGQIAIYRKGAVVPDHDVSGVIRLGLPPDT